jgi:hypothetical protein
VDRLGDGADAAVEDTNGARVGEHDAGGLGAQGGAQGVQVEVAIGAGGDLAHLEATHGGGGGIGAVSGIRDQDLATFPVAPRRVVGANHGHAGEFTLGAGGGGQGYGVHAGDLREQFLQLVETGQDTLAVGCRRQGMARQEAGQGGQAVAGPGVVLHGTGAQGIEMGVDGKVLLRQPGVMAHGLEFGDLRQGGRVGATQMRGQIADLGAGQGGLGAGAPAGAGDFLDQHLGSGIGQGGDRLGWPPRVNRESWPSPLKASQGTLEAEPPPWRPGSKGPCRPHRHRHRHHRGSASHDATGLAPGSGHHPARISPGPPWPRRNPVPE